MGQIRKTISICLASLCFANHSIADDDCDIWTAMANDANNKMTRIVVDGYFDDSAIRQGVRATDINTQTQLYILATNQLIDNDCKLVPLDYESRAYPLITERRIAEEKAAAERRIAEEKVAKERRLAKAKAAEEIRIAEEKAAAERRIAEEKVAKERRLAKAKAAEEIRKRYLNLKESVISCDFPSYKRPLSVRNAANGMISDKDIEANVELCSESPCENICELYKFVD